MSEEAKARAEANLTRMLALARHQQSLQHVTDPLPDGQDASCHVSNTANATMVSPRRFFLPRKSPSTSSPEAAESEFCSFCIKLL